MLGNKYFQSQFLWRDYLILALVLCISVVIGIYYAVKSRKKQTTAEYLLAGRNMSLFPVSLSLIASFSSAIGMLGNPTEYYYYSLRYAWQCVAFLLSFVSCAYLFLPVFYTLGKTSVYEYLGHRFDGKVRFLASLIFVIKMMLYTAVALYAPSLALNAIIGISLKISVIGIGAICIFYTVLGGMKAVLWTDAFQTFLIYTSLIAVIVKGFIAVNPKEVWRISEEGGRLYFFDFRTSPFIRYNFWSACVGGFFVWSGLFGINQTLVQRYLALPTFNKARLAVFFNGLGMASVFALHGLIGLLLYSYYSVCDPISAGFVQKPDQILPYFSMEMLQEHPGLPGLFVAGVFSACLSTISSGINSIAAIILEDFIKIYYTGKLSEKTATYITKFIVLIVGTACLGLAFLCGHAKSISQMSTSIFGLAGGPLLGIFLLGILFPWANALGAFIALLSSTIFIFWIGMGTLYFQPPTNKLNVTTSGCEWNSSVSADNLTSIYMLPEINTTETSDSVILDIYKISYMWYSLISSTMAIVVGLVISFITSPVNPSSLEPKYIYPGFYKFFFFLPKQCRDKLTFGIKYRGEYGVTTYNEEQIDMEVQQTLLTPKVSHYRWNKPTNL